MKKASKWPASNFTCRLLVAGYLLDLLFDNDDGSNIFLRNFGEVLLDYKRRIPEDSILQTRRCEDLKFNTVSETLDNNYIFIPLMPTKT
jgi:hypothetical protein